MAIEAPLAIHGGPRSVENPPPHYTWPEIRRSTRIAVLNQLDSSISIYDRSGIIEDLERKLEERDEVKHALLFNSGTSALFAMFVAMDLSPGDEVICPAYTFFASASPLLMLGVRPVLVDCRGDSNIDPTQLEAAFSPRTKAVLVTHMWGRPCDMDSICEICNRRGVPLLEDISHAYGATYGGRRVGRFGCASALSLQGQKVLPAGEGGVLLTGDSGLFYRALALGHYNKRCVQEIPPDHELHEFAITGMGLKLRIHPLAAAIARDQLDRTAEVLEGRRRCAEVLHNELAGVKGLLLPPRDGRSLSSWYAFVFHIDRELADSMEAIQAALLAEGCLEIDRPKSTAPLHHYPLFSTPEKLFPSFTPAVAIEEFPIADDLYARAFKLPVWHRETDIAMARSYAAAVRKVIGYFRKKGPDDSK